MPSTLTPNVTHPLPQRDRSEPYGPSDTSDSASDAAGTPGEFTDSDAAGTGERAASDNDRTLDRQQDIEPDRIVDPEAFDDAPRAVENEDIE